MSDLPNTEAKFCIWPNPHVPVVKPSTRRLVAIRPVVGTLPVDYALRKMHLRYGSIEGRICNDCACLTFMGVRSRHNVNVFKCTVAMAAGYTKQWTRRWPACGSFAERAA